MAEREGFEPSVEFPLHTLSRRAPSTARSSLRLKINYYIKLKYLHKSLKTAIISILIYPTVVKKKDYNTNNLFYKRNYYYKDALNMFTLLLYFPQLTVTAIPVYQYSQLYFEPYCLKTFLFYTLAQL